MLYKRNPQLNRHGELIHLLSTEGLSRDILTHILDTASQFVSLNDREVKKFRCCAASRCSICFLKTAPAPGPLLRLQPNA